MSISDTSKIISQELPSIISLIEADTFDQVVSEPSISTSTPHSNSETQKIKNIIKRIHREKIPYIGIYKPGELGRETLRAVLPSPRRRGTGRGVNGQWESIVLSTSSRSGIGRLIEQVEGVVDGQGNGPVGVRHMLNPHCNQDEGVRIVWPISNADQGGDGGGNEEMKDWSRRDRMIRDGKTVKAIIQVGEQGVVQGQGEMMEMPMGMDMGFIPILMGPAVHQIPVWDNIGWTRLY